MAETVKVVKLTLCQCDAAPKNFFPTGSPKDHF
jgi:hypothetical protein